MAIEGKQKPREQKQEIIILPVFDYEVVVLHFSASFHDVTRWVTDGNVCFQEHYKSSRV
jgi:hypothetical protein